MASYDLVVFGATGFTGSLAAKYIAKQYQGKFKWAVAGRSLAKLEAIKKECNDLCDVIVAEASDDVALSAMVRQTKVVLAMAGPFSRYGSKLVSACVAAGTDYCDITGEVYWVREMIAKHDNEARRTGARIVHLCGHDSIPWDLTVMMLAKKIKADGGSELGRVDLWDENCLEFSGGSVQTVIDHAKKPERSDAEKALGYDALLKAPTDSGETSQFSTKVKNIATVERGTADGPSRAFFIMADCNGHAVKRSNALLGYGSNVEYCEGKSFESVFSAWAYLIRFMMFVGGIVVPPVRALLFKLGTLPQPGEGPSEATMKAGYLVVTGVAKSTDGKVAKTKLTFPVDPGYLDTARMIVESGLSLAHDSDKLTNREGGVKTPAACQGEVLLNRLVATGSTFSYLDP